MCHLRVKDKTHARKLTSEPIGARFKKVEISSNHAHYIVPNARIRITLAGFNALVSSASVYQFPGKEEMGKRRVFRAACQSIRGAAGWPRFLWAAICIEDLDPGLWFALTYG